MAKSLNYNRYWEADLQNVYMAFEDNGYGTPVALTCIVFDNLENALEYIRSYAKEYPCYTRPVSVKKAKERLEKQSCIMVSRNRYNDKQCLTLQELSLFNREKMEEHTQKKENEL